MNFLQTTKKLLLAFMLLSVFAFCFPKSVYAQFTETFEAATIDATSFTSNGKTFNLANVLGLNAPSGFKVFELATSGYSSSNRYIHSEDGTAIANQTMGQTGTIKAASGTFKLNSLWIYLTGDNAAQKPGLTANGLPGSVTFKGKLNGVTLYTVVQTTAGNDIGNAAPNKGFILSDFATLGGSDNSNTTIDELEIELSANYDYFAIDNFTFTDVVTCVVPTITANPPNRSLCSGNNTTFTASATGATAWQWYVNTGAGFGPISNGGVYSGATTATLTITGATAGMSGYMYRAVAINGDPSCSSTSNAGTLNVSNISLASGSTVNVSCNGANNGILAVAPNGGIGSYTYSWTGSSSTSNIVTGLAVGSYTVTVTDAVGCSAQRTFTITQPTALNGSTVVTNVACFGGNTGAINLTPSGGTPGYTFLWSDGATTEDRTSLVAGTYSVTITDANDCTSIVSGITVTQPTAAVSGTTVVTNVACFGGNTGAINLTPTGGVGPYTFNWTSGPTTEDRTGLVAGTYSVTITDANGCTGTVSGITVTQPNAVVSGTTVVTNVACFGGNTGAINLTPTGGVGPYTYNWTSGPTTEDRTGLTAGTYSVTITDANGCQGTVSGITVTQPTAAVSGTTVVTNVACFGGNTGAINLTPTGGVGPYTYNWTSGPTTEDRTGLTAGTYSVTITDANGCQGTVSGITVTQPTSAVSGTTVVTNVSCNGGTNGSINLTPTGGVGPYTFNWVSGPTTEDRTGLAAGSYSVTITDANGCTGTVSGITVTQPTALIATAAAQNNVSCFGGGNGTATVTPSGGTPGYTYSWSPSGGTAATASGLTAGTYTVTVTDANSCQTTQTFTITQPAVLALTAAAQTNIACFGGATGAASVNAATGGAGGYTYDWSPGTPIGDGTTSVTGLIAGTYTVTVTDANGCTAAQSFTITQPPVLTATAGTQNNVSCFAGANGTAAVNVSGGTPGYTYSWAPSGGTAATATGLAAGTYTVTVTDANGCSTTQSFTITAPSALTATVGAQTDVSCNGGSNGTATVSVTGGTGAYTYAWSPSGGTAATATGLMAGTYTVTVIDANACITTQTFTINQPNALALASASLTDGAVGAAYSRTFVATGGNGTYTYSNIGVLPAGMTLSSAGVLSGTPTAIGSYPFTIMATDIVGCFTNQSYILTIGAGVQTITFAPLANKVYGDAAITLPEFSSECLPITYVSSNQNVATITGNTLTITGAGTTNITASQAGNGSYLAATDVVQSLTVTGKPITGTFTVSNKAYDGTTTANIQTRTLVGVAPADQANVSLTGGTATFASVDAGNGIIVSQTGMSLTGSKAGNYILQSVAPSTGTINPTPLTVTANALSKAYGDADPVLTYSTSGLIAGDALSGSLSRSAGDGVGSYAITASGLNAGGNYILNFVGADFTINKRVLTITADNKSRLFNTANPTFTFSYAGFANGETSAVLTSPATASTTATISSPGGTYPIVPGGAAAANYSFNYMNGTLTVTANSQTITFAALADKLSTDPIFTLNATSSAGLTVSFSSSDAGIARIVNGNQVEILKAGTVNITASQAGNASYAAATPVVQALKINDNPAPVIAISSSRGTSFNKGESTTLTATGATTYVWSNAVGIISGQNTDKLTVRPVANTVYTVTGSNQYGRTSTQTIAITVVENLAVVEVAKEANLLTPDGDGVNDYFVVKNIDLYPNNTVTIYDMTGKTLYKTKSYKNDWDGSINGNPLQTGTYFYIIEFGDGKTNAKKGYITVVK